MCHRIVARSKTQFLRINDTFLCGMKKLAYTAGRFKAPYQRTLYNVRETEVGLEFVDVPHSQDAKGDLKLKNGGTLTVRFSVTAAMHVSPPIDDLGWTQPCDTYEEFTIPVLFRPEDVAFYDGYDVSVRAFYIPTVGTWLKAKSALKDVVPRWWYVGAACILREIHRRRAKCTR